MVACDRVADRESEEGKAKGEHHEVQHRRLLAGGFAPNAANSGGQTRRCRIDSTDNRVSPLRG
jgi:hypothetical protein